MIILISTATPLDQKTSEIPGTPSEIYTTPA